jgi:hypothetical protein
MLVGVLDAAVGETVDRTAAPRQATTAANLEYAFFEIREIETSVKTGSHLATGKTTTWTRVPDDTYRIMLDGSQQTPLRLGVTIGY